MNVLSLFDGISCGQQALERAGIKVDKYFASEIDKYAIKITMANYPDTIQLGSVVDVDGYSLPKIDLLIGGSPCQSFSFAGKRKGMSTKDEQEILTLDHYLQLKAEGYEFEGQSYLFWEYMRLMNEVKPTYFLLENVMMGQKWERVLSKAIGVNPIEINSSLVSAQNRRRLYWTNIGMVPSGLFGDMQSIIQQPKDKNILLKDILEKDVDEKYFLSQKMIDGFNRHNEKHKEKGTGFIFEPTEGDKKAACLRANAALCATDNSIIVAMRGRPDEDGVNRQELEQNDTGKSNSLTSVQKDNLIIQTGLTEVRTEEAKKQRKETGTNDKRDKELVERNDGKTGALLTSQTPDNLIKVTEIENLYNNVRLNETLEKHKDDLEDGTMIDSYNQTIHKDKSITISTRVNASSQTHIVEIKAIMLGRSENWGAPEKNDGKSYTLCKEQPHGIKYTEMNDNMMVQLPHGTNKGGIVAQDGKTPSMTTSSWQHNNMPIVKSRIRRLTPTECEKLQTVRVGYSNHVSDSQRYKALGNGWTVDVIAHIFSYIK